MKIGQLLVELPRSQGQRSGGLRPSPACYLAFTPGRLRAGPTSIGADRLCEVPARHGLLELSTQLSASPWGHSKQAAWRDMNPVPMPCTHRRVQVLLAVLQHVHDGPHRQQRAPGPENTRKRA